MVPVFIIFALSEVGATVRRLRSAGFSPWFAVLLIVPIVDILLILALFFLPGEQTTQQSVLAA
jgi:uncharacterized membrane protein YhaH (DUF805 family)